MAIRCRAEEKGSRVRTMARPLPIRYTLDAKGYDPKGGLHNRSAPHRSVTLANCSAAGFLLPAAAGIIARCSGA